MRPVYTLAKCIAVPFLAYCCIGCSNVSVHRVADGRIIPNDWLSAPIQNLSQDRASRHVYFDSVYMFEPSFFTSATTPPEWIEGYYRFWPDGQVLFRPRYGAEADRHVPTAEEADDFRDFSVDADGKVAHFVASVGRYNVVGDQLTIVTLGVDEAGWRWVVQKAVVSEDGSIAFGRSVARRCKVEGMRRFPDW
jgi:hypothetical protein